MHKMSIFLYPYSVGLNLKKTRFLLSKILASFKSPLIKQLYCVSFMSFLQKGITY